MKRSPVMLGLTLAIAMLTTPAHGADKPTATLFIAPLVDVGGDAEHDGIAAAMPDLITTLLRDADAVAVVDRGHLQTILSEHELERRGLHEPEQAIHVGRLVNATWVATGSLAREPGDAADDARLRATLQLWHAADGRIVDSVSASAATDEPLELAAQLAEQLAAAVDVDLPAVDRASLDDRPLPTLHMLRGLGYFHAGHYDEALMAFFTVTALDPHHDQAAFQRVLCYLALDEVEPAIIELRTFIERYEDSPLHEQATQLLAEHESIISDQ